MFGHQVLTRVLYDALHQMFTAAHAGAWGLAGTQGLAASSPSTLAWHPADDRVSADIHGEALWPLLEDIAHQTGWHILVEPGADRLADVKFNNLPPGEALKKLLGDLNFALVPQTNGPDSALCFPHHDAGGHAAGGSAGRCETPPCGQSTHGHA
jgi:hypothetical protein